MVTFRKINDDPVPHETAYAKLVELAQKIGGDLYDFDYIEPHRTYRALYKAGLVRIDRQDPANDRWRIARLTVQGERKVGMNNVRRRRRRRGGR